MWSTCADDEALWEHQFAAELVPFWREMAGVAAAAGVKICLELHPGVTIFNASGYERLRAEVGPQIAVNLDPSHFWWQGVDPLAIIVILFFLVSLRATAIVACWSRSRSSCAARASSSCR